MRKILLLLISFLMFSATSVKTFAQCVNPEVKSTISVTGMANENYPPDTAFITLSVETQAKTVKEALSLNNQKADVVIKKLQHEINKEQKDSIKTTSFNIQPVYDYDNSKRKSFLVGYRVINQVMVTTKNIHNTGNIIDVSVQNGANRVQNISFGISDKPEYCNKLLEKASQNAKEQAEIVSKALGVKIIGVKSVSLSCNEEGSRPMYKTYMNAVGATADAAPQTPIEAGDVKVNATVNVDFYINNP